MSASDAVAIRECVENWVVWRDAGDWDRFATVWHSNGWMTATWFQGPATEFIRVSKEGFERGVNILHALNGWSCDVSGTRAISQVKMNIFQRAPLDGVAHKLIAVFLLAVQGEKHKTPRHLSRIAGNTAHLQTFCGLGNLRLRSGKHASQSE